MSYLDGRRSEFPNSVDKIEEKFNMPPSLRASHERYKILYSKQELTPSEQLELNQLTINLRPHMPDPEYLNFVGDALINGQKFFKDGVEPYIENKKLEFQAEIDKFVDKGEWKPDTWYYAKNIVVLGGNGYLCKKDNINQPPPNTGYWSKIGGKGEKGDPSLNISFKGEYDPAMAYVLGDAVTFGDLWYYAKKNTKGNLPTMEEFWEIAPGQIVVGDTIPFDNRVAIWINTNL